MNLWKKLILINLDYYMILFLSIMALYGIFINGIQATLPQLLIAVATASLLDILISYSKTKQFIRPYHAIITGIFIGTILPVSQNWYIPVIVAIVAILSKHLINVNHKHLFNPAVLGLLFASIFFKQPLAWWGAAPLSLVLLFGLFVSYKFKRLHLTLTYIVTNIVIWSVFLFVTNKPIMAVVFSVNYYFVFFMLVEPVTSPIYKRGRILYGFSVAVISFIFAAYSTKILGAYGAVIDPDSISLLIVNLVVPFINKYIRS